MDIDIANYFAGDKIIFTGIAVVVLLGAFLTISLVPLWAPGKRNMYAPDDEGVAGGGADTADQASEAQPGETQPDTQHSETQHSETQLDGAYTADGLHTVSDTDSDAAADKDEDKA